MAELIENLDTMTEEGLRQLLARQESDTLEFKLESEKVGDLAETLMSFANAHGGTLLVGVNDEGRLVGVSSPKQIYDRLYSAARQVTPSLAAAVKIVPLTHVGRVIIGAQVPPDLRGTYTVSGAYRRRLGSYNVAMTPDDLVAQMSRRGLVAMDNWPVTGAVLADIDPQLVEAFLRRRSNRRAGEPLPAPLDNMSFDWRLINLGLLNEGVPTVAAVLMFGRAPQRLVPHSEIQCARFLGTTPSRFLDREYLTGTLPELIEGATQFIRRHTRQALDITPERPIAQELDEYPFVALREALTNAVTHREYLSANAAVRLLIFDDRIELISPGGLLPGLDIDHLRGQNMLRNRVLAELLHVAGYVEKFGTGIARMEEAMRAAGLPAPRFANSAIAFKVTLAGPGANFMRGEAITTAATTYPSGMNQYQLQAYRIALELGSITTSNYRAITGRSLALARRDLAEMVNLGVLRPAGQGRSANYTATPPS